ncbi:MAG: U32 family peptidase, partial [Bacteriovoracales bacterium]
NMTRPEILSPAGSLEKLKVAVLYGADAVYLAGLNFGLRSAADNFTNEELIEGVRFAHERNAKVYVVLNSFLHDKDLLTFAPFIEFLNQIEVDAVIISDIGVLSTFRSLSNIDVHLSTQASCLNIEAAKLWKKMGVKRIVLGREVSILDAQEIKEKSGLEVEMFVHGSMCMAYSGNCVISNFTMGRDSNRGGCAHNCRFDYTVDIEGQEKSAYFMSSKDLKGLNLLNDFSQAGIDSLKIEGRMKTNLYVGTVTKTYKRAITSVGNLDLEIERELEKLTHREYTEASLTTPAGDESIYSKREHEETDYSFVGTILEVIPNKHLLIEVRSAFFENEHLEIIPFTEKEISLPATPLVNILNEGVTKAHPGMLLKLPFVPGVEVYNLVRRKA